MGIAPSCCYEAPSNVSLGDYLAFLAGDEDYELTLYGVRKTAEATERATRGHELRLEAQVNQYEQKCHNLESAVAEARATALYHGDQATSAPGGIKSVGAQASLTAARLALTQLARQSRLLANEYTRLELGRSTLDAIRSRAALQEDRRYFESIHIALNEARVPPELLAQVQAAGNGALAKFSQLDVQNTQYTTTMHSLDRSLVDVGARSTQEHFGAYNLGDTDSLLAALNSLRTDSHHDAQSLEALNALPPPGGTGAGSQLLLPLAPARQPDSAGQKSASKK